MSIENNVQTVKNFFAAMGRGDKQGLLALSAEDIEWIIPGKDWPLAGTHRGHAGLTDFLQKASDTVETSTEPSEYVAQGDRVLVVGVAKGKIKATNKPFKDDWIFAITVRNGKVANIREYIDTQALARASEMDASPGHNPSKPIQHETIRKVSKNGEQQRRLAEAPNGGTQLQRGSIMLDHEKFIRKVYTYVEGQGIDTQKFVS